MIRFDDHRPSLWTERGHRDYGHNLTSSEFLAEELEDRPSRLLPLLAEMTGLRVPWTGAPGADRLSRPTPMAPGGNSCPASGPDPEEHR